MKVNAMNASGVRTAPADEYAFDNVGKNAEARYRQLSRLYDANTIRHIELRGIDRGWSCLEVGGGGGSIASWLCARVGVTGRVLATDIHPQFLQIFSYSNLEVRRHDIRSEALPSEEFDLAHVRLVLMHLPERENALRRMVDALKPGGWIVAEEFDALTILPDPTINSGELNLKVRHAFHEVLTARGVDLRYGRLLARRLRANGLVNIGVEASASLWAGKSAGTNMMKLSFEELREPMVGAGLISEEEFEADLGLVGDQDYFMPSPMMWTAWGQRP